MSFSSLASNGHYVKSSSTSEKLVSPSPRRVSCPKFSSAQPLRHPDLSFDDGNLAVLAGQTHYFLVHKGLLCRRSTFLEDLIRSHVAESSEKLEGRAILRIEGSPEDVLQFLLALYDGLSCVLNKEDGFHTTSILLRFAAAYQVESLRRDAVAYLTKAWPSTLSGWDRRERLTLRSHVSGFLDTNLPHPIMAVNLAREVNAPQLLPSAFYDLCRHLPSEITFGFMNPDDGRHHALSPQDLIMYLRGREALSRFFSTFIVNELESRKPSVWCQHRNDKTLAERRQCQGAFELVTYEMLRDVNGAVCGRTTDPLFAMTEALRLLTRDPMLEAEESAFHGCDCCRLEFAADVDASRETLWSKLPEWFNLDLPNWA